jgi:hypothetical protein
VLCSRVAFLAAGSELPLLPRHPKKGTVAATYSKEFLLYKSSRIL